MSTESDMQDSIAIHAYADVKSDSIGVGTNIWQYVVILPGAVIGKECNICSHVFIENDVVVGNRVTIKNGVQLWDGLLVGSDVFIGPNATFANDRFPRSKHRPLEYAKTIIEDGASIGAGAVILPGIKIGSRAMVGAGAVVTRNVPPNAIVVGNPARITGYVDSATAGHEVGFRTDCQKPGVYSTAVEGVTVVRMPRVVDIRGSLTVGEFNETVPFDVKRYFMVFDVPSSETRGEHAHIACHQFLICVRGNCAVVADNGIHRQEFTLNSPDIGVHLPPMIWGIQYKYTAETVLLVFASEKYDPNDYIRDYSQYLKIRGLQ